MCNKVAEVRIKEETVVIGLHSDPENGSIYFDSLPISFHQERRVYCWIIQHAKKDDIF